MSIRDAILEFMAANENSSEAALKQYLRNYPSVHVSMNINGLVEGDLLVRRSSSRLLITASGISEAEKLHKKMNRVRNTKK